MSWDQRFYDPIPLPGQKALVTQAAMQALLLVAEHDGPTMFARIGVMRALNRHVERAYSIRHTRIPIGDAGSWRGINDGNSELSRLRS
jgi:hypothetical protein